MKYTENIEPLNDEEKSKQKRDFFFVIIFYVFFVSVFIFIISSFDYSDGGDIFVYVVLSFIGCIALFLFITFLRDFISNEKIVQRGIITNKESVVGQKQNSQKQFYFYFDSKEIPVSPAIFSEYATGDTIEISRTRYSRNIIGARILTKRDHIGTEDNELKSIHTHRPRRSALQFDRKEMLEPDERKLLLKQLLLSVLKRLPLLFIIWIATPLILLFLFKTALFSYLSSIISIDFSFTSLSCMFITGTFVMKKCLLICLDVYKNEKEILYKTVASVPKRHIQSNNENVISEVVFDDGTKDKVQSVPGTHIEANMLLEIHKTVLSKIVLKTNLIE